jgi:hypothetical protein
LTSTLTPNVEVDGDVRRRLHRRPRRRPQIIVVHIATMAEPRAIRDASASPADGCFPRQPRCKVNERVDVIVAVNVKVLVNVIVEDKVERSRIGHVLLAGIACDPGSVAGRERSVCEDAAPYPVEPVRRRALMCAREHAGAVRSEHPRTATVQNARADIRRQRRTCPSAGRHG